MSVLSRLILAEKNKVFFGTDEIVRYIHCTLYIKRVSVERGYTVPETWKRYHFRAEPPCIGHYRKYLLWGVTSRYLQSGDQLELISTDSTPIGWVSHVYMNMFKMLELWCPWIAPVKIHAPIRFFPSQYPCFISSLFRSSLWFVDCCLCFICTSCLWTATLFNNILFSLSCLCTMEVVGISVEVRKFVFLESDPGISGFTCIEM